MLRKRTLHEWEELWRTKWDINDYADLDAVFANTEAYKNVLCEVEIRIMTRDGRIDIAEISLVDDQGTVLAGYEYTMLELGRSELEQEVIAPLNLWPEDEEEETSPETPAASILKTRKNAVSQHMRSAKSKVPAFCVALHWPASPFYGSALSKRLRPY